MSFLHVLSYIILLLYCHVHNKFLRANKCILILILILLIHCHACSFKITQYCLKLIFCFMIWFKLLLCPTYFQILNKSTYRAQISNKATHYSHIAWTGDLESAGRLESPKFNNYSLCHWRVILKISSQSAPNLLNNDRISD